MENTVTQSLLEEALAVLQSGRASYLESQLQCGGILSRYILARMEARQRSHKKTGGPSREEIIQEAASSLDVKGYAVNVMIAIHHTVRLLSDGGNYGDLPAIALRFFSHLVGRAGKGKNSKLTDRETWNIKPLYVESGPALFRRAVAESMTGDQVKEKIMELRVSVGQRRKKDYSSSKTDNEIEESRQIPTAKQTLSLAASGSPKDTAEMLVDLVFSHQQSQEVLREFQALVDARLESQQLPDLPPINRQRAFARLAESRGYGT